MEKQTMNENEPNFKDWTTIELFDHLMDLHQIPYEEEFEDWKYLRLELLELCEDIYELSKQ